MPEELQYGMGNLCGERQIVVKLVGELEYVDFRILDGDLALALGVTKKFRIQKFHNDLF